MSIPNKADDGIAIRALYQRMLDSWATGDGHAYAEQFTHDADYIVANGTLEKGREEIASGHQQIFDTWAKNSSLMGQISSIRFLSSEIAFVVATGSILMSEQSVADSNESTILLLSCPKTTWTVALYHISEHPFTKLRIALGPS